MKNNTRIGLTILVVFIAIVMSGGIYVYSLLHQMQAPENNLVGNTTDNSENNKDEVEEEFDLDDLNLKEVDGITNILLLGVDERSEEEPSGADAIMILTLDNNRGKIKVSSINRDLLVELPGYGKGKITDIYRHKGTNALINVIEYNLGINLDNYVKVNFNGFKEIIDIIGGVELSVDTYDEVNELNRCMLLEIYEYMILEENIDTERYDSRFISIIEKGRLLRDREDYPGTPYLKDNERISQEEYEYIADVAGFIEDGGTFLANGEQALAFSRMRHVEGGVYGRGERQMEVVQVVLDTALSISPIKYISLANEAVRHVKTNMSKTEMLNLAYTGINLASSQNGLTIGTMQVPPSGLEEGFILDSSFLASGTDQWVSMMDKYNTQDALHGFIFDDVEYDSSKYPTYHAANDGYYKAGAYDEEDDDESVDNSYDEEDDNSWNEGDDSSDESEDNGNTEDENYDDSLDDEENQGDDTESDGNGSDEQNGSEESDETNNGSSENESEGEDESQEGSNQENNGTENGSGNF